VTWLFVRFARPRRLMFAAVVANLVHPIIHGTMLDSGALDSCLMALNATCLGTAVSDHDHS
jgi:hypothetical protein